jgi:starvation-inducible DNA-binding protein
MAETTTRPKTFTPALENGVAYRLQHSLVELIDLDLQARQAHWNVVGPNVRSLRDQFDEISVLARLQADALAERLAALQVSPDGALAAVCESPLEQFPVGWLDGPTAAQSILARIDHVSQANVIRIKEISGIDPVAETILVDLVGKLDRAAWMLRAQEG